jgi:hypothetical protein
MKNYSVKNGMIKTTLRILMKIGMNIELMYGENI